MSKFTDDEKVIARNIDKRYKWMARDKDGILCVYPTMPVKEEDATGWSTGFYDVCRVDFLLSRELFKPIKWEDNEPTRISDIYDPQILDDVEREYLRNVLKPFHDGVKYVVKHRDANAHFDENTHDQEFLFISLEDGTFTFPDFDEGKMYSGMEIDKKYKLDEIGITYTEGK